MRKIYLLMMLFITSTVMAQTPIITMVMSGNCTGQTPKMIEIYADGTVDFANYSIENQLNAATTWGNTFDLSPLGTVTDDFVYIYKTDPSFATEFPGVPVANTISTTSGIVNVNGDDGFRIIETLSTNVIDNFGEEGVDGTGEPWEYVRGYVKRLDNTGPDVVFNMANWSGHNMALDGLCGTTTYEVITGAGSYTNTPVTAATITASPAVVGGFVQVLGNPSAEKTVNVSGLNLTSDIEVAVNSGDYEISLATGTGFGSSVTIPFGTGTVTATPVYVRLNGAALANPAEGDLLLTSTTATDVTVDLDGVTIEYTVSSVGDVTGIDAEGVGTSIGEYVTLTGVLHCDDFRGSGYDLTLIDDNNDGINVFSSTDIGTYTPTEGDEIKVEGKIDQYNGLIQINPATITLISQNAALQTPTVVTALGESTESQYIKLENLTLVNGEANWPDHGNIDVTNGVDTFLVRVPGISPMADTPTPTGAFNLTGIGKQFDNSNPYDSGYQLFPCGVEDVVGLSDNEFNGVSVYPNPVNDVLNITNENGVLESVVVVSATGSVVYTSTVSSSNFTVNTANLNAGVYFVNVRTANNAKTFKVIK